VLRASKDTTVRAVHPNAGTEAEYRRKLDRLVSQMHRSLVYWLTAAYRANEPEMATDESPAMAMRNAMRALTRRWTKEFAKLAQDWGPDFAKSAAGHTDRAFAAALKKAGFTVRFKLTPEINDIVQASIGENVSLIKSIAAQHLSEVEGIVMRSVQRGRDLGGLTEELEQRFQITRRRAAGIAADQNAKATAVITEARQAQLGIAEGIWMHSGGGKKPRPSHVAANGKRYQIGKGMWIDGEWIRPGEKIRCRCVSRSIIPGFN
jgi:SPP1 gp7 family putative phage head morphogenesis protein